MPWSIPVPALTDRGFFQKNFTVSDGEQQELNLWDFFGQPDAPSDVTVTFDSIEVRTLFIGNWPAGSTINITGTSSMQFRGRGGKGGDGAVSFFEGLLSACLSFSGALAGIGDASIICPGTGITINYNGDDCFAWGGGGGGGGGGYKFTSGDCASGCGGGGGQGWDVNVGGASYTAGCDGASGDETGPGLGGTNPNPNGGDGGDGGSWGTAGAAGLPGVNGGQSSGGIGGRAIQVPATDTLNLTGLKSQVTLEGEGRLLGRNGDPIGA